MADMMANHISSHVPGEPGAFLINAYGMMYEEITASSLIKVDHAGNILSKPDFGELDYGINKAGYVIHSAVHAARPEVACVIHTHSWASMAVSSLDCGLLPLTQTAMRFLKIGYHDYQGVVLDTAEQASLIADLGEGEALILRNHGALVVGRTVGEAFNWMHRLELACRAQIGAMACNTPLRGVPAAGARGDLEQLPARHPAPLRRDGVAGAAAQARPDGSELSRLNDTTTHGGDEPCNADTLLGAHARSARSPRRAVALRARPPAYPDQAGQGGRGLHRRRHHRHPGARRGAEARPSSFKQPFVIDNKPGAGGNLGTEFVVRAPRRRLHPDRQLGRPDGGQPDAVQEACPTTRWSTWCRSCRSPTCRTCWSSSPTLPAKHASRNSSPTPRPIPAS